MSWWNAKYTNNDGEYEITFASKDYEKAKAVEKVCCAVMDKDVKSSLDVEAVVRCKDCKHAWIHPCGYVYCHRDGRNAYEMTFNLDSFCSYGERKEGADNG